MTRAATKLERKLETHFYDSVRRIGGMCEKVAPTRKGMPDRMVLLPGGRIYLVELKTDVGVLEPAQVEWHRKAALRGVKVQVLYGQPEIDSWILTQTPTIINRRLLMFNPRGAATGRPSDV